jgi:putative transposase
MSKSKFIDEQIIALVAEQERGMATADVWRRQKLTFLLL